MSNEWRTLCIQESEFLNAARMPALQSAEGRVHAWPSPRQCLVSGPRCERRSTVFVGASCNQRTIMCLRAHHELEGNRRRHAPSVCPSLPALPCHVSAAAVRTEKAGPIYLAVLHAPLSSAAAFHFPVEKWRAAEWNSTWLERLPVEVHSLTPYTAMRQSASACAPSSPSAPSSSSLSISIAMNDFGRLPASKASQTGRKEDSQALGSRHTVNS